VNDDTINDDRWHSGGISAMTLFVEDVTVARDFYSRVFDVEPVLEEGDSVVFRTGSTLINLLRVPAADELVRPAVVGSTEAGVRAVYTIEVADVDAVVAGLRERSIELLNGPIDRWWGPRTASFGDPFGHVWEIAGPPHTESEAGQG
jgi:uncharacterized glyoxalase superfamily protein PhnB